jgi:hypothetical protein
MFLTCRMRLDPFGPATSQTAIPTTSCPEESRAFAPTGFVEESKLAKTNAR